MKVLEGNKVISMTKKDLEAIVIRYKAVIIDIGTGNGQFVYRRAKADPENLYIGVDSSQEGMTEYSIKANKKSSRGGVENLMFVVDNVEDLSREMESLGDKIYINLPWGSLRDGIVRGDETVLGSIRKISRDNANIEICVAYNNAYEKKEIENRNLPELSLGFIRNVLKSKYRMFGFIITEVALWNNEALKTLDTKWAKKLAFGRKREVFFFRCSVIK